MSAFTDWLADLNAPRQVLIDLKAHNGASEVTYYVSDQDYTTEPSDYPSNTYYESRLKGSPYFERRMPEAFGGRAFVSIGEIVLDNADGALDAWLDLGWKYRNITIRLGEPSWSYSQFEIIFQGKIERLEVASDTELVLVIRDRKLELDRPIQQNLFTTGDATDKPIPLCYGTVYNITPVIEDNATHKYRVHDGAVDDVATAYYLDGVSAAPAGTETSSGGYFALTSDPQGALTVDADGAHDSSSVFLEYVSEIMQEILTTQGGIDPSDFDTSSFTQFNTDAPYKIGVFVPDNANLLDVLDSLIPAGWFYGFMRDGTFKVGLLKDPSTEASTLSLTANDIEGNIEVTIIDPASWRSVVGYKKNWTVQTTGFDSTIGEARQAYITQEYQLVEKYEDSSVLTQYPETPEMFYPSMLNLSADATTEATRLQGLFGTRRYKYIVNAFLGPYQVDLNDVVTVTDDRFGLSEGVKMTVIGITEYLLDNKVELELWR